jgi:hypothetical protein
MPASEKFADFRQCLMELVTTLSEIENRHPVAVLNDNLEAERGRHNKTSLGMCGEIDFLLVQPGKGSFPTGGNY